MTCLVILKQGEGSMGNRYAKIKIIFKNNYKYTDCICSTCHSNASNY